MVCQCNSFMDTYIPSSAAAGRWRRNASPRTSQARTVRPSGNSITSPEPDNQMHMVYCCQNHSGSPALTAPVPKKALTPCATVYGFDAPFRAVMQVPPSASLGVASVTASLHTLKQAEHVQEQAAGTGHKGEDHLILAASRQTEPELDEADRLSSHASLSGNNGSLSSLVAEIPHHQPYSSSSKSTLAPVLHSVPAKHRSFLTWPLLQGAQDGLHHSLLSAAHAADNQSLLLPHDVYSDSVEIDSAQRYKLWYSISSMFAAVWQFLCSMGGTLKRWGQCCPSAAESDSNI